MKSCCFHARKSLVQEIAEGLRVRGYSVPDSVYDNHSDIIGCVFRALDVVRVGDEVELVSDYYGFFPQGCDCFKSLSCGERGTVISVDNDKGGCYVDFPYIRDKYPKADSTVWVTFDGVNVCE